MAKEFTVSRVHRNRDGTVEIFFNETNRTYKGWLPSFLVPTVGTKFCQRGKGVYPTKGGCKGRL